MHKEVCLNRKCTECGVKQQLHLMSEETATSDQCDDVNWECYEYIDMKIKGDKTIRKLQLVKKTTKPGVMFAYFIKLLETFPSHQFRATWQSDQLKHLLDNLPQGNTVCVHDYSENFRSANKDGLQSDFFKRKEISIHVTILYRHSILEYDGPEGDTDTETEPKLIIEQFSVISPDLSQDRHFTASCQKLVSEYLQSFSANITTMHKYTDGCSSQYKVETV